MAYFALRDKNGSTLLNLDEHFIEGPHRAEPHTHHQLEISCVLDGFGDYLIGGKIYDLLPGDIIILNNTEPHGLIIPKDTVLRHLVIHFDPSFIWNSLSNNFDYNFLLIFFERGANFSNRLDRQNPATGQLFQIMKEIQREFAGQQTCYELMIKIKLQTIFAEIIRHYDYIDAKRIVKPLPESDINQLNAVLQYIENHLDSDLSLPVLASIVHVSPAYFSTLFKRFNGVTPVEYIVHKRIQRAIEMIHTSPLNLTEIAMACGFNNSTNFYKAFHKVTGKTPATYRRTEEGFSVEK